MAIYRGHILMQYILTLGQSQGHNSEGQIQNLAKSEQF